jgi:hypothetical protein
VWDWLGESVQICRGFQVLMFATTARQQESPLDRQITTPENQASAEFNPINPLEQGLDDRFFVFLTEVSSIYLSSLIKIDLPRLSLSVRR